ncbi:MAG: ActS/PrrB/RegB family redox-sensitive histidine kinase [Pseudomonadota bacterium]
MPHALTETETVESVLQGPLRLRTLTTLRWLAIAGQTIAIVVVHFALGFPTPLGFCLGAIAASAWLNIFTVLRFSPQRFLSGPEAAAHLAFDLVQLCALLFLTGGLQNPFSVLIIAPVTIAASVLPLRLTILLAGLGVVGVSILAVFHMSLPWDPNEILEISPVYSAGVWAALTFSILFFAAYARRVASESAQMRSALNASQLVLAREERLMALGGLAAAAAHELGTPLATIQITAKEMQRELQDLEEANEYLSDDADLVVAQAERCRDILRRLSSHGDAGDAVHDRLTVDALLREAAAPYFEANGAPDIRIEVHSRDGANEPVLQRRPEMIYGLRNFVENAVGFARREVVMSAEWDEDRLSISVNDDGPGFSPEILARLGEPYVSARAGARDLGQRKSSMGLGFFIAKTLLERTGAAVDFTNGKWGDYEWQTGARVVSNWALRQVSADPIA